MLAPYFVTTRPEMLPLVPPNPQRVLEVGCSSGGFSSQLGAPVTWGIEPNAEAAQIAATKLTRVFTSTFGEAEAELPDHYFDLVIANDVIEHMPDHHAFFEAIQKKMAPGALIIGSLPNMRHITALVKLLVFKNWEYRDEGILDRTHLRFFTRKSIIRSLQASGLEVIHISGKNGVLANGFVNMKRLPDLGGRLATAAMIAATFGYYADVQYPQYAFVARAKDPAVRAVGEHASRDQHAISPGEKTR